MPHPHDQGHRRQIKEFDLIRQLRNRYGCNNPLVLQGIGDDAAILRTRPNHDLLLSTDVLCEGTHFDATLETLVEIGYKAAVANLSDIAAMGGQPQYILPALAIPPSYSSTDIKNLYRGMMEPCKAHEVTLVGGDMSSSRSQFLISITVVGHVESGQAMKRDGAKSGDLLYVTGTLGDSLAGLKLLTVQRQLKRARSRTANDRFLIKRHLNPTPRILLGRLLVRYHLASAAIDLSDGLSGDIRHLCQSSGVGVDIHAEALPLSPQCRTYATKHKDDPIQLALTGGEDYELAFTIPLENRRKLERISQRCDTPISCIGVITPHRLGIRLKHRDGHYRTLHDTSFQHFRSSYLQ